MLDDPTIGRVASGDQVVLNMIRTTYTEAQLASSTSDFYNWEIGFKSKDWVWIVRFSFRYFIKGKNSPLFFYIHFKQVRSFFVICFFQFRYAFYCIILYFVS